MSVFLDDALILKLKMAALAKGTNPSQWITAQLTAILNRKRKD